MATLESNHPTAVTRRDFLKLAGGAMLAASVAPAAATTGLPTGKIGKLAISRLMLGTNIITHHVHARDLNFVRALARQYNTDEKVLATFAVAEQNGINTFMTHHDPHVVQLFRKFRDHRGGKMNWIVAPDPSETRELEKFKETVKAIVQHGADALYVHGAAADPIIRKGGIDYLAKLVEALKETELPAGVAAHDLEVVKACEAAKLPCDFYMKTFHHLAYPTAPRPEDIKGPHAETPHGYWCAVPEETAAFMKSVTKPWIGFKVMAAGAIPPRNAFQYAYGNGTDFILAGMFDFEVAEDAQIATEVLANLKDRPRPWRG